MQETIQTDAANALGGLRRETFSGHSRSVPRCGEISARHGSYQSKIFPTKVHFLRTMQSISLNTFFRTLSFLLLAVGLLVVGCDSGGSSGDPDRWVGNWKQTDGETLTGGDANFAISLSKEEIKTTERADCTTRTMEVTNVNVKSEGNSGSVNIVDITLGNGDVYELRVPPGGGDLLRVFFPDGREESYAPADDSKTTEEIVVGCP